MAEIRLDGIDKVYPGGTHAVHGVDLHIADGEFMIMVGPSGCAKSTILRMIAGLETPTGGTVSIGGRVVNDVAPKDRDIAMVFQSYALYPHMTVRENMAFGLRLRKMPPTEIDARVADAARILGLEHLLDRLPKAMSGGQRQRVAMGRAIVREPQAFLMDEPLSNLDAKLRVQMRTEIAKLHQRLGTTTVYVTHDQVEAMTLGQRICILRKGLVQQVDTPHEVYRNPANIFVGSFIGSPGMNFLVGRVIVGQDGSPWLRLGQHAMPLPASVAARMVDGVLERDVVVGIRPEHVALGTQGDPATLPVRVDLVETMGAEQYAYVATDVPCPDLRELSDTQAATDTFVARLDADQHVAAAGTSIALRLDLEEVHLFDPQSQRTILAPVHARRVQLHQPGIEVPTGFSFEQVAAVASPARAHEVFQTVAPVAAPPMTIASVFDQPVANPVTVEPLVPAMPAAMTATGEVAHAVSTDAVRPSAVATWATGQPPVTCDAVTLAAPSAPPSGGFAPRRITDGAPVQAAAPTPRSEPVRVDATPPVSTPVATTTFVAPPATQLDDAIEHLTETAATPSPFRSALATVRGASSPNSPAPFTALRATLGIRTPSTVTDGFPEIRLAGSAAQDDDPPMS